MTKLFALSEAKNIKLVNQTELLLLKLCSCGGEGAQRAALC